jgi:AraC family transcriptional regulator
MNARNPGSLAGHVVGIPVAAQYDARQRLTLGYAVEVIRRTLFESAAFHIGAFECRPQSDACGDVEQQESHALVLPVSGVFLKHDAPGRHVTGTSSHAVLVAARTPYRLSFPGAIGDRALILRFGDGLADDIDAQGGRQEASQGLLPGRAMMLRNLLWTRLAGKNVDAFEAETLGHQLIYMSLGSMRTARAPMRASARLRRHRALERVREAVALTPAANWSVTKLAEVASLSPFHLCHVFREMTGTSIYNYVLRERLALALDAVLDGGENLTAIALDAGFASHSHFTAHFRRFFGCSPTALRRGANTSRFAELRKIMTARARQAV